MKRLFVAISFTPGDKFLSAYKDIKNSLYGEKIKWVDTSKIHLTLKFIGKTPDWKIPEIKKAIEESVYNIDPFELEIKNAGIFGSRYNPRVIWFGISKNPQLNKLTEQVVNNLDTIGIKKDRQNLVPHLTIGRIKNINNKQHLAQKIGQYNNVILQTNEIHMVSLYESVLTNTGSNHYLISSFNLPNKQTPVIH